MTDQPTNFAEAPASVNFYGVTKKGWNVQFTLRDADEAHLIQRMGKFMAELENAYGVLPKPVGQQPAEPKPQAQAAQPPAQVQQPQAQAPTLDGGQVDPAWCVIHNCEMKRRQNEKGVWYSHKVGEEYCNGKAHK